MEEKCRKLFWLYVTAVVLFVFAFFFVLAVLHFKLNMPVSTFDAFVPHSNSWCIFYSVGVSVYAFFPRFSFGHVFGVCRATHTHRHKFIFEGERSYTSSVTSKTINTFSTIKRSNLLSVLVGRHGGSRALVFEHNFPFWSVWPERSPTKCIASRLWPRWPRARRLKKKKTFHMAILRHNKTVHWTI